MDGIHDLGGKQGHGRLAIDPGEAVFRAEWEARVFGLYFALCPSDDWSGDWFRHCRELIPPVQYLTRPYYDQWLQTLSAMLINSGAVRLEEIVSGRSDEMPANPPALQRASDVQHLKHKSESFERASATAPKFLSGATVRVRTASTPGHTRLPQYLRGQVGQDHPPPWNPHSARHQRIWR